MSWVRHERMVCFDDGRERFQMRAAGIALRDGYVLLQRVVGDSFWALPGGRIEQNETSGETLVREMEEELGVNVAVGPISFLLESFFPDISRAFHEIGFYHCMDVPLDFPFATSGICHSCEEGPVVVEFGWLPASEESLEAVRFYPRPLRPHLATPPEQPIHIVDREGER